MRKHLTGILLVIMLFAGAGLLVYPTFANWWNNNKATNIIADYDKAISHTDESEINKMWEDAIAYNKAISGNPLLTSEETKAWYERCLNATGTGIIGYIEIPGIRVSLPIYHGTGESILQTAIGHVEWSSLPTGTDGSHVIISGHRGLPSARLFTDIDQLAVGDEFSLEVLNKEFTYEVDNISIVLPYELSELKIEPGYDYCTLVTCTPYGVNTHRLLVRGHRVDTGNKNKLRVSAEARTIRPVIVAPFVALPMLLVLAILLFIDKGRRRNYD